MPKRKAPELPAIEAVKSQATISLGQFCELLGVRKESGSRLTARGELPVTPIKTGKLQRIPSAPARKILGL